MTERLERKKSQLLELATECLAQKPDASLNEIADYSGVGIATLHRYFASRDGLLNLISHRAVNLIQAALQSVDRQQTDMRLFLEQTLAALIPLGNKVYFLQSEVFKTGDQALELAEADIRNMILAELRLRQQRGQLRPDIKVEWMFQVVYSLLFTAWQAVHEGSLAPKDAAALVSTTLLEGFGGSA